MVRYFPETAPQSISFLTSWTCIFLKKKEGVFFKNEENLSTGGEVQKGRFLKAGTGKSFRIL